MNYYYCIDLVLVCRFWSMNMFWFEAIHEIVTSLIVWSNNWIQGTDGSSFNFLLFSFRWWRYGLWLQSLPHHDGGDGVGVNDNTAAAGGRNPKYFRFVLGLRTICIQHRLLMSHHHATFLLSVANCTALNIFMRKYNNSMSRYWDTAIQHFKFPLKFLKKQPMWRHNCSTSKVIISKTVCLIAVKFIAHNYVAYIYIHNLNTVFWT